MKTLFEINHEGLNAEHEKRERADPRHMTHLEVTHNDVTHTHERHGYKGKELEIHHFD